MITNESSHQLSCVKSICNSTKSLEDDLMLRTEFEICCFVLHRRGNHPRDNQVVWCTRGIKQNDSRKFSNKVLHHTRYWQCSCIIVESLQTKLKGKMGKPNIF